VDMIGPPEGRVADGRGLWFSIPETAAESEQSLPGAGVVDEDLGRGETRAVLVGKST
jgi:hypothetical protein